MPEDQPESPQPGPIYDSSMRALLRADLDAACRLADIKVEGELTKESERFQWKQREVDLLLRVGPRRLAHFEVERQVEKDLALRMLGYRYSIKKRHPDDDLTQCVIVLGTGTVRGHDDFLGQGFTLDLRVVYVRDIDPAILLADPALAPLAVLGRGSTADRQEALAAALQVITLSGRPEAPVLLDSAMTLALIRLDETMIGEIMSDVMTDREFQAKRERLYRSLDITQRIADEARREARIEARREGQQEMLLVFLRDRFGDAPGLDVVVQQLVQWPDQAAAVHAITSAASYEDLRAAL